MENALDNNFGLVLCPECRSAKQIYLNQFTSRVKTVNCGTCNGTGLIRVAHIVDLVEIENVQN